MKRKVLVCVLACCMLFMGMGYAYWTDSLQIDTTATTGELDVKFVDLASYGQYPDEHGWAFFDGIDDNGFSLIADRWNQKPNSYNIVIDDDEYEAYLERIKGYTETDFTAELVGDGILGKEIGDNDYVADTKASDKINISVTDMYPGYAQLFRSDIVNPGTIAAELSKIEVDLTSYSNDDVKDMIGVSLKVLREGGTEVINLLDEQDDTFVVGDVTFVRLSAIEGDYTDVQDNLLCLYPSSNQDEFRMDLVLGVAMDPDAEGVYTTGSVANFNSANDDATTQLKTAKFSIQFLWDQFNAETAEVDS